MVYTFQKWLTMLIGIEKVSNRLLKLTSPPIDKVEIETFNEKRIGLLKGFQERGIALLMLDNRFQDSFNQNPHLKFNKLSVAQRERVLASQSALTDGLQKEVEGLLMVLQDIRLREYTIWEKTALLRIVFRHMEKVAGVFGSYEDTVYKSGISRHAVGEVDLKTCKKVLYEKQREVEAMLKS